MDQVHDFHLQLLQEIGFVREIDQALSKSLMVEFLRFKIIIGDDLSRALRTWQTDMEVATDKFLSRSARLPTPIQMELTSPLRRGNHLVEPSRSDFPFNSLSVATRPQRVVPRMVSHPPKCARSQRPRRPRLAPQPGPRRQPSRKLGLNCSKRTSQRSRRFVPGSSNSRREK